MRTGDRVGNLAGVLIRDCTVDDLELLEECMPTRGTAAHASFLARQRNGEATYLVAWYDGKPVGSGVIRWAGDRDPAIRAALPGCPAISNLGVTPARQGQGVGRQLTLAAEDRIRRRGYTRAGIGVGEDNLRAARLYARLGYVDTGLRCASRYDYPDQDGVLREVIENDIAMVREL